VGFLVSGLTSLHARLLMQLDQNHYLTNLKTNKMSKIIVFSRNFQKGHPCEGEPTYFIEKIYNSLIMNGYKLFIPSLPISLLEELSNDFFFPKHHTIRSGNRFKVGDKFDVRVWEGKPYRSKQLTIADYVEIKKIYRFELKGSSFLLDGRILTLKQLKIVAKNDGLECDEFEGLFNSKPFSGQLICWSDKINYDQL